MDGATDAPLPSDPRAGLRCYVKAKFVPTEGESERGPDFRIFAGATDYA